MTALWEPVKKALEAALQQYGAGVVLLVAAVIALFYLLNRSWQDRIRDKDEEIRRMADSKRVLEEIILKNRLSSTTKLDEAPSGPQEEDKT